MTEAEFLDLRIGDVVALKSNLERFYLIYHKSEEFHFMGVLCSDTNAPPKFTLIRKPEYWSLIAKSRYEITSMADHLRIDHRESNG